MHNGSMKLHLADTRAARPSEIDRASRSDKSPFGLS
jgi:hypothetical protein